jgi:hypothetical protein
MVKGKEWKVASGRQHLRLYSATFGIQTRALTLNRGRIRDQR